MSKAQVIHKKGLPSCMKWEDWHVPDPKLGEVRIRHTAIGVNYADTYHRAGISHPWPVPEDLDDKEVAALLMKGMTAHYLLHRTYAVQPGDTILVHAAAGGMGLILCQWARALGATIVGTVSTYEKAEVAKAAGCHFPVVRSEKSFVQVVREVTNNEGCAVVYEAIGKDTLQDSLDTLRPMGTCAAYGHVSGPPDPVDIIQDLGRRGSLFITRPAIMHYVAKRADLEWTARDLFKAIGDKIISANINYEYELKDAVQAHTAIESGKTLGASVLVP